jgi:hypothetical protein
MNFKCLNTAKLVTDTDEIVFTVGNIYYMVETSQGTYMCENYNGNEHYLTPDYLRNNFVKIGEDAFFSYEYYSNNDPESRYWKNAATCAERFSYDERD